MRHLLLWGGIVLCATASSAAEESTRPPDDPGSSPVQSLAPASLDAQTVAAMQAEITARIESGQKAAQQLNDEALAARGAERLRLLEQLQERNETLHLDILRIQARHTRAAGFVEAAERIAAVIETRIEARANPTARVQVQKVSRERPTPREGSR